MPIKSPPKRECGNLPKSLPCTHPGPYNAGTGPALRPKGSDNDSEVPSRHKDPPTRATLGPQRCDPQHHTCTGRGLGLTFPGTTVYKEDP